MRFLHPIPDDRANGVGARECRLSCTLGGPARAAWAKPFTVVSEDTPSPFPARARKGAAGPMLMVVTFADARGQTGARACTTLFDSEALQPEEIPHPQITSWFCWRRPG